MLLKYFYDKTLAQASYLVGCAETGEAIVIDPARDISSYLRAAEDEDLRITQVTETHIHADFVSGSRELAAHTGATLYLSDMGDTDWKYGFANQPNVTLLHDGDTWMLGNIRLEAIHTPGHTPEHLIFLLTDTRGADRPMGVFTGDFVFVGDVGRPDLLEEAAGMAGTKERGARDLFESIQRFKEMPDYLQIWPGHGAGSACGKALGAVPSTTLGYEKLFNPAFQFDNATEFTEWLLDGQPEPPRYFARMKRVNKAGPALLAELSDPARLTAADLDSLLQEKAFIIDLRSAEAFNRAHLPGTLNVPATVDNFTTYVGWFVDYDRPTYLIVPASERVDELIQDLRAIGVDNIPGYFGPTVVDSAVVSKPRETLSVISAQELSERISHNGMMILDVRGKSEYREKHIAGARNIPLGHLPRHLGELPHDSAIVTHCTSGYRSHIAASWLQAQGYDNIINMNDDMDEWARVLETRAE